MSTSEEREKLALKDFYKVYYFKANTKAANIRGILMYKFAKWENVIVDDWPAFKQSGKLEFGQLPALEINNSGKFLTQTIAIEVFLARRFNLFGNSLDDEYEILNLLASRDDIFDKMRIVNEASKDPEKHGIENKNFLENVLPFYLNIYEKKFNIIEGEYFLGDNISLADIYLVNLLLQCRLQEKNGWQKKFRECVPEFYNILNGMVDGELACYTKNVYIYSVPF
jgi:glutathione S-transferase